MLHYSCTLIPRLMPKKENTRLTVSIPDDAVELLRVVAEREFRTLSAQAEVWIRKGYAAEPTVSADEVK